MANQMHRRAVAAGLLGLFGAGAAAPQAARYGTIARRESQYATTYIDREGDYIAMTFGINDCLFTESLYNPNDPTELPVAYTRAMTVALAYTPRANRILEIGLGGGRTASYLHDFLPQANITAVELDPGVISLAQQHFGVRQDARLRIIQRDGRIYVNTTRQRFDIIMVDAYQGTLVPFHLVTREFFGILKRKLNPGGVVVQNISPDVLNPDNMIATARTSFARVDMYRGGGNQVLVAYDGPAKTQAQLTQRATALQQAHRLRYPLAPMIATRRANATSTARVYTDDFAPVGYHDRDRECRATGRG
ncbi:spermidine synthase-like protein [alpha proteobacterium U9-1i]|nr:spermidine synthase-like protein [alpha proteobacterium U9-1i]